MLPKGSMKSAVFLERDGILNAVRVERNQPISPLTLEEFQPNPAALQPLRQLKASGFTLIVTTNQPSISRGLLSRRELDRMHDQLKRFFPIDDILVCAHDPADQCSCRKPRPGLFQEAAFKWHLDLERSFVVSDRWQDAQAAQLVGATSLLLRSPWNGTGHHDFVLNNLGELAAKVNQLNSATILAMDQVG